jgi:uncharacterized protein YbbK (DUF523 family)
MASHQSRYRFIVSACLAGAKCTFKGKDNHNKKVARLVATGLALAACPELAGGLGIPRERSEIISGDGSSVLDGESRVISESGRDLTREYIAGAVKLAKLARGLGVERAVLKSDSPACGTGRIYDGSFSGKFRKGDGVFAAALKREGVKVHNEKAARYG